MASYTTETLWQRNGQDFTAGRYSRRHLLRFDGGTEVAGSSSPHVVPLPWSDPAALDPEEAFISALSSCHMLWFLSLAAQQGYCVESYHDRASGVMQRDARGKIAITRVTLHPETIFSGKRQPDRAALDALHHAAHEECYIANSVLTEVVCEPVSQPEG